MNPYSNYAPIIFTVLLSIYALSSLRGQSVDTLSVKIEDNWIEKMDDKIGVDISLNNSYETFEVKTESTKFIIYPNTATNLRLNVNYRFISFGYQFTPDFLPGNGDENLRGKTKSFQLTTAFIFKHWFSDLSYTKVRGYYLENSNDFTTLSDGDPYIQFPDLNYYTFNVTTGYSSNSNFSFRSLTSQTERQLKSAGSFIPVVNFRYYVINDKSDGMSSQKTNNFESSIGPGYIYTFVHSERFYLSLGLLSSVGYLNTKLTTRLPYEDIITHQDNFIFRWDGKAGLGYNGKRFYSGLYATVTGAQYRQENTTAINYDTQVYYHLFFGMRLSAPHYLERKTNEIEKLIQKDNTSDPKN